jgi:hypothetical protein
MHLDRKLRLIITIWLIINTWLISTTATAQSGTGDIPSNPHIVSVSSNGVQGDGWSFSPSLSGDGRLVAFISTAENLVPGDSNDLADIFVYDTQTRITERVSINADGASANGLSYHPQISADGRFVSFTSIASNLVGDDTNNFADIFVFDRLTNDIDRVSVGDEGTQSDRWSDWSSISADGRYVVFSSAANNLVYGDTNQALDVFLHDRLTGQTRRVSVGSDGSQGNKGAGWGAKISADGRFITFSSTAENLVPNDTNQISDVFIHNRVNGKTERISTPSAPAAGISGFENPTLSWNGSKAAYGAQFSFSDFEEPSPSIFLYDRSTGLSSPLGINNVMTGVQHRSAQAVLSSEGGHLAFTKAENLAPENEKNRQWEVVLVDLENGDLFSIPNSQNNNILYSQMIGPPSLSGNGNAVAFSAISELQDPENQSGAAQIYLYTQKTDLPLTHTMSGRITDPAGMPIRSAMVSLNSGLQARSDRLGHFSFSGLEPGDYTLIPSKQGFAFTPSEIKLEIQGDVRWLQFQGELPDLIDEARKDLGMPYSFDRGCDTALEGCGGSFHGFHAGYCTDLILDAYLWGVDFNLQFVLERDALVHPDHYYRWRNARNSQDMWRFFQYTDQMLPHEEDYIVGDIAFFDWENDGVIDHVALISEVDRQGRPQKMVDATGEIEYNPGGLTIELSWRSVHEQSIKGHGRWYGSFGANYNATPNDFETLQIAIDSPMIIAKLWDKNGHLLSEGANHLTTDQSQFTRISGGKFFDMDTGIVMSVPSPRAVSDTFLLELTSVETTRFYLHMQSLEGARITESSPTLDGRIQGGETKYFGVILNQAEEEISFTMFEIKIN